MWLLEFPAGFKPNANLGIFLGNIVLQLIGKWNVITTGVRSFRIAIVIYVSIFGALGCSIQLAAINDVLFLCSTWLVAMYSVFASMYKYSLSMMMTLTRLFSGTKFNVLRQRNDANNFSVSELFMGVLIITLGIFLLPTVAIFYYYAFMQIILSVLALQLLLIVMQTLVFDFPYFLVCFSIVKPYFLPNSIRMRVDSSAGANGVIMIESLPVNKGSLFAKLAHELKLLIDTQTFKKILSSIVRGLNLFRIMQGFL